MIYKRLLSGIKSLLWRCRFPHFLQHEGITDCFGWFIKYWCISPCMRPAFSTISRAKLSLCFHCKCFEISYTIQTAITRKHHKQRHFMTVRFTAQFITIVYSRQHCWIKPTQFLFALWCQHFTHRDVFHLFHCYNLFFPLSLYCPSFVYVFVFNVVCRVRQMPTPHRLHPQLPSHPPPQTPSTSILLSPVREVLYKPTSRPSCFPLIPPFFHTSITFCFSELVFTGL